VKLLFDQNLSHELVKALEDLFAESAHVRFVGLSAADDNLVWDFAHKNGFIIVTKDVGFQRRSLLQGFPPKVVLIRTGNCATRTVADLLRKHAIRLRQFAEDTQKSFLVLF
jgi:predicted nuclease of predicted toxin-antitoxin system